MSHHPHFPFTSRTCDITQDSIEPSWQIFSVNRFCRVKPRLGELLGGAGISQQEASDIIDNLFHEGIALWVMFHETGQFMQDCAFKINRDRIACGDISNAFCQQSTMLITKEGDTARRWVTDTNTLALMLGIISNSNGDGDNTSLAQGGLMCSQYTECGFSICLEKGGTHNNFSPSG